MGERIRHARLELSVSTRTKVSQEQLGALVATQLGKPQPISGATVSRWEAGTATPDLTTLEAIAAVCRVNPGWLVIGVKGQEAPTAKGYPTTYEAAKVQEAMTILLDRQALLIVRALERTREWRENLVRQLRLRMEEDTPQARRRCKEIVRELDGPTPLEILAQDLFMSEEDADRARRRQSKREQRYEEEDQEEQDSDD